MLIKSIASAFALSALLTAGLARAEETVAACKADSLDDAKKDGYANPEKVAEDWCKCMVPQANAAKKSLDDFAKANPAAEKECDTKAGWI